MVLASALKQLLPPAWTALLAGRFGKGRLTATDVKCNSLNESGTMRRYLLKLEGHHDPVSLIAKSTELPEARFYRELAPGLSFVAPHCWFSHSDRLESWIVLDEVYNDYPPSSWNQVDIEKIIGVMTHLHASFWEGEQRLKRHGLSLMLDSQVHSTDKWGQSFPWIPSLEQAIESPIEERPDLVPEAFRLSDLSEHTVRSAGRLAPIFAEAVSGLELIRGLGGWPGVLDEQQMMAISDLIEDPLPMLYPLRLAPKTLLHGQPQPGNWFLSLLGEIRLLDWKHVCIGPAVLDLIAFIEGMDMVDREDGKERQGDLWALSQETLEDSYILMIGKLLGKRYDATAFRQLIPPARCLFTLITWLPWVANWSRRAPANKEIWHKFNKLSDEELGKIGFSDLVRVRPYLSRSFDRFIQAYRML